MEVKFVPGTTKAWRVALTGHGALWSSDPDYVSMETTYSEDQSVIPPEDIAEMEPGDILASGPWTVTCHMVDADWLANLPEHEGW